LQALAEAKAALMTHLHLGSFPNKE